MTSAAGTSDLDQQLFDLAAVCYRADPSDENFAALSAKKPERDDYARLSALAYETAAQNAFGLPLLAHLVKALATEGRYQEAAHFCAQWLEKDPANIEALRLSCIISCKRMDRRGAVGAFETLQKIGANEGLLWALDTVMLLSFTDGALAAHTARPMLTVTPRDPIASLLAAEVAYRLGDSELWLAAFHADRGLANDNAQRVRRALEMLQKHFINVLNSRYLQLSEATS